MSRTRFLEHDGSWHVGVNTFVEMTERIKELGPSPIKQSQTSTTGMKSNEEDAQ